MNIRKATEADCGKISYLIQNNIEQNPNDYSTLQKEIWKKHNTPAKIKQQLKDRTIFCAFNNTKLVGTIALQKNCIVGFYISYALRNKGIGTELFDFIETYAKKKKCKELHLVATPSAFDFYLNNGFILGKEIITILSGVDYIEFKMKKVLV